VHEAPDFKPAFVRAAVESIPLEDEPGLLSRLSIRPTFGEEFVPLRSAVQSVPSINKINAAMIRESSPLRSFVRDSVEAQPIDDDDKDEESELDRLSINYVGDVFEQKQEKLSHLTEPDPWSVSDKYAAFIAPSTNENNRPQSYRSGSPHQQLLQDVDIEQLEHIDDLDRYTDQQLYGALAHADFSQSGAAYGALSQLKATSPKKNYNLEPKVLC